MVENAWRGMTVAVQDGILNFDRHAHWGVDSSDGCSLENRYRKEAHTNNTQGWTPSTQKSSGLGLGLTSWGVVPCQTRIVGRLQGWQSIGMTMAMQGAWTWGWEHGWGVTKHGGPQIGRGPDLIWARAWGETAVFETLGYPQVFHTVSNLFQLPLSSKGCL